MARLNWQKWFVISQSIQGIVVQIYNAGKHSLHDVIKMMFTVEAHRYGGAKTYDKAIVERKNVLVSKQKMSGEWRWKIRKAYGFTEPI